MKVNSLIVLCAIIFIVFFIIGFFVGYLRADEIDDIIPAIIVCESNGDPNAVSKAGCMGLMQINPKGALKELVDFWNNKHGTDIIIGGKGKDVYAEWKTRPAVREKLFGKGFVFNAQTRCYLKDPEFNRWVGEWYLRRLKDHYLKDIEITYFEPYSKNSKRVCINRNPIPLIINKFPISSENEYKLALILAAYNGGITRLRAEGYDINEMPRETRNYVRRVMRLYNEIH